MKSVKKVILPLILALIFVCGLSACSSEVVLNQEEQFAADQVQGYINSITGVPAEEIDAVMASADVVTNELNYKSFASLKDAIAEFGAYQSYELVAVTETGDDEFQVKGTMHFENADTVSTMTLTLAKASENFATGETSYGIIDATPLALDKVKTIGEKMVNAGLNTLMGVGIVFLVLILISLIISSFSLIGKIQNRPKKSAEPAPAAPAPAVPEVVEEEEEDETELVAVIAAAIAAYEGTTPEGLVVRSIRKVSSANKWKRG